MPYAELQVTSNYSFLRGASHVEELLAQAAAYGMPTLAITDRNSLAGIARAHHRAKEAGIRLVVGCRLDLDDGTPLLLYPRTRPAYSRLCRLLSLGKGRTGKGGCRVSWDDVDPTDLVAIRLADEPDAALAAGLGKLRETFGRRAHLALTRRRRPKEATRLARLETLARAARIATVATGDVLYHAPQRRILQDVLTCIREGCTIDDAGFRREPQAERHLRPPAEMARLFAAHPDAVARTDDIAADCAFSLDELRYQYPEEAAPGRTAQQTLEELTWASLPDRYANGASEKVIAQLRHELALIAELDYAPYFLTVHNIVAYARGLGILCQGRGSAANSAVCYVIGITAIDPTESGPAVRAFRLHRAPRAARHRRRLRA